MSDLADRFGLSEAQLAELVALLRDDLAHRTTADPLTPVTGRVVNFQIREQTPVARWQFTSVGTIMDLSDNAVLAIYPQNQLKYVKAGDKVEIAFRRMPVRTSSGATPSWWPRSTMNGRGAINPAISA